ncbi:hypothetical protein HA402_007095 [Bradysia odoriphaga]|nr:hypothetical protein HA402_007095 [Bradysia odoriphaga]
MCNKNLLLSCVALLAFVVSIQCVTEDLKCFEFIKRPTTQGVLPSRKGTLPGKTGTVELARHHVIPFQFLRIFFNFAATVHVDATLRTAIDQQIRHLMDSYVDSKNIIPSALLKKIRGKTDHETIINALQVFYSWLPGNIFYGPKPEVRSDDPGSAFEVDCYEIIGDKNYKTVGNLYVRMVNFVESSKYRTVSIYRQIVEDLFTLFTRRTPFEYDQKQWEVDPKKPGKYRIHRAEREDEPKIPKEPTVPDKECIDNKLVAVMEVDKAFLNKFPKSSSSSDHVEL